MDVEGNFVNDQFTMPKSQRMKLKRPDFSKPYEQADKLHVDGEKTVKSTTTSESTGPSKNMIKLNKNIKVPTVSDNKKQVPNQKIATSKNSKYSRGFTEPNIIQTVAFKNKKTSGDTNLCNIKSGKVVKRNQRPQGASQGSQKVTECKQNLTIVLKTNRTPGNNNLRNIKNGKVIKWNREDRSSNLTKDVSPALQRTISQRFQIPSLQRPGVKKGLQSVQVDFKQNKSPAQRKEHVFKKINSPTNRNVPLDGYDFNICRQNVQVADDELTQAMEIDEVEVVSFLFGGCE